MERTLEDLVRKRAGGRCEYYHVANWRRLVLTLEA
jgi:hypothetical protein